MKCIVMKHYYEKNIVEIREEYTNFLVNIITPLLYEGVQSLYNYALKTHHQLEEQGKRTSVDNPGVLKIFQTLLKGLPDLNTNQIENESNRMKESSRCSEWFDDLVKAVIKSNIVLLTYSSTGNKSRLVESKYHERIETKDFVHKCYIEMGRAFYDNPELFRHDYPSLKIKKNQRETCSIIRTCVKQAIRKMLPIKLILQEYLTNDYVDENGFGRISADQYRGMRDMVNRDLNLLDSDDDYDPEKKDSGNDEKNRNSFEALEDSDKNTSDATPSDMVTSVEKSLMNIGIEAEGPERDTSEMRKQTFIIKQALKEEDNPIGNKFQVVEPVKQHMPSQHMEVHHAQPQQHIPVPKPGIPDVDLDHELQQFMEQNNDVIIDPAVKLSKKRINNDERRFLNQIKEEAIKLKEVKEPVKTDANKEDMKKFFSQYQ